MELSKERMLQIAKEKEYVAKHVELSCGKCGSVIMQYDKEEAAFYEKVIELLEADAEGRMVVLPVKVGEPCSVRRIAEKTTIVDGILKYAALVVESDKENMLMNPCNVFADRDEAEAALEKMRGVEE